MLHKTGLMHKIHFSKKVLFQFKRLHVLVYLFFWFISALFLEPETELSGLLVYSPNTHSRLGLELKLGAGNSMQEPCCMSHQLLSTSVRSRKLDSRPVKSKHFPVGPGILTSSPVLPFHSVLK